LKSLLVLILNQILSFTLRKVILFLFFSSLFVQLVKCAPKTFFTLHTHQGHANRHDDLYMQGRQTRGTMKKYLSSSSKVGVLVVHLNLTAGVLPLSVEAKGEPREIQKLSVIV